MALEDQVVYFGQQKLLEPFENLDDIKPALQQEIEEPRALYFEPYSMERETELIEDQLSYGNCNYPVYEKVGDWLVLDSTKRDYCYMSGGGGGMCPSTVISHTKFLGFLISNPNIHTLPYLLRYIIAFALLIGIATGLYFFIKKYSHS